MPASEHPHQSQQPEPKEVGSQETNLMQWQRQYNARPTDDILGTGRRKTSVARVRLRPGEGTIVINDRALDDYFRNISHQNAVLAPLVQTGKREQVDMIDPRRRRRDHRPGRRLQAGDRPGAEEVGRGIGRKLRENALLTRDGRMKERKKYGLRGARRGTQFSKR